MNEKKPKTPQVSLRGEIFDQLKKYCEDNGLKLSRLVDELCKAFFERRQPEPGLEPTSDDGNGRLFTDEEKQKLGMI